MYEEMGEIKKSPKNNMRLWVILGLGVTFLVLMTVTIIGSYLYYTGFRGFVSDFSQTTNLNYRKGTVLVTTEDEEFYLTKDNIYYVYNVIVNSGRGRVGEAPEREPDAVLDYHFGGKLELWIIDLPETSARKQGLFISFTNDAGEIYAYDTDRLSLDQLPLSARQNKE